MGRFNGKNIFVTISCITNNHNTEVGRIAINQIFEEFQTATPRGVWETAGDNDHVHILYTLDKSKSFSLKPFEPLLELFGTRSLDVRTWHRSQTYVHTLTGNKHRGKPGLWLFEKIYYCDLPDHEEYFDKEKLSKKKPTVVNVFSNEKTALYHTLRAAYDRWVVDGSSEKIGKPKDLFRKKVFEGITQEDLDDLIHDTQVSLVVRDYALENYDKLVKKITILETIKIRKERALRYLEEKKKYRPFQSSLSGILDTQNDRNIHAHVDAGLTGKNKFCEIEAMREDTCIIQSAKTADIAFVWDPKKHKRIIIDVPRGKMKYLNTSVIEKLKNGQIFSTKYIPVFKESLNFKPNILILGNETLPQETWTNDRLTHSTTSKDVNYEIRTTRFICDDDIDVIYEDASNMHMSYGSYQVSS